MIYWRQFPTNGALEKPWNPVILHTSGGAIVSGPALPDGILQLKLTLKCEELFGEQCHLALQSVFRENWVEPPFHMLMKSFQKRFLVPSLTDESHVRHFLF